jgi:hypothetical protein
MGAKTVDDVQRGSGQWRMAVRPRACARRPRVTGLEVGACHAHRRTVLGEACHGPAVTGLLRRACPAVRRRGMPMARCRALGREGAKIVRLTPFSNEFSPDFKTEVTQTLNTKVVQQVTIFKNANGCMGFFSRV